MRSKLILQNAMLTQLIPRHIFDVTAEIKSSWFSTVFVQFYETLLCNLKKFFQYKHTDKTLKYWLSL